MPAAPHPAAPLPRRQWLAWLAATGAWALPAGVGAQQRRARRGAHHPLAPGQSFWLPELAPAGPAVALVNLHTQHVQVFRNGVAVGYSSASTGKPGHGTPTGLFRVLEKRRHHRSSTYNNAPMPWMVRLTWSGIAFHGGALPGYPASHGCIRLPMDFAPRLFGTLARGDVVAVVRQPPGSHPSPLTTLAPVDAAGQPTLQPEMLSQPAHWADAEGPPPAPPVPPLAPASASAPTAPPAPLTLLASLPQRRLFVLREGRVLAAAALAPGAQALAGQHLFDWDGARWQALGDARAAVDAPLWHGVLPASPGFAERLRAHLTPASRLLVSPLPAVGDVHVAAWQIKGLFRE